MIKRQLQKDLLYSLSEFPATVILGARQVGKTTLAYSVAKKIKKAVIFLDLEKPSDYKKLEIDAESFLSRYLDSLVVIDEVQRMPHLFSLLRALIDEKRIAGRFLLLGSSSIHLVRGVSESLAGRVSYIDLSGINLIEASKNKILQDTLWFKGGFPEPLLAKKNEKSNNWYVGFVRSYIEKDMNQLFGGIEFQPRIIARFWQMLAHNSSTILNREIYSRALGISIPTINKYLDYMEGAFLIWRLYPWQANVNKRLVKSPKIYISDTGILHHLNDIKSLDMLLGHTLSGASWEGFVLEQIRQQRAGLGLYFYRTHQGAEVDLVLVKNDKPIACIEIKLSTSPQVSKGFYEVIKDLQTKNNYLIMPGGRSFPYKEGVWCYGLKEFLSKVLPTLINQ